MAAVAAMLAAVLGFIVPQQTAQATTAPDQTLSVGGNTFFAYVEAGESVDVNFVKNRNHSLGGSDVQFIVTDAAGSELFNCEIAAGDPADTECTASDLTGAPGVWTVEEIPLTNVDEGSYLRPVSRSRFDWTVDVASDAGDSIPGRVWVDLYLGYDLAVVQADQPPFALDFWAVSEYGAQYLIEADGFVGGGWNIRVDAFGVVDPGTCDSLYHSTEMAANSATYDAAGPECGDTYRMFFEPPAPDLPPSAPSADGDLWIVPPVTTPEISELTYTSSGAGARAGTFDYALDNFTGSYELRIDVDGDGDFDGPADLRVPLSGTEGQHSYEWDGLDDTGEEVDVCQPVNVEVGIDRTDEVHFVLGDAEALEGGVQITQLAGNSPGNTTIYWDDTQVSTAGKDTVTPEVDGTTGVDSIGGVHGWDFHADNPWGNQVAVDNWTYSPVDITQQLALSGACLEIEKTSDATEQTRVGDTVTYTVTATNVGEDDYTEENPATIFDDLVGVLDDASYNGDATATVGDDPWFVEPSFLRWTGPLPAGESVEMTYSVALTAGGDGIVRNVTWAPEDPPSSDDPPEVVPGCDPPNEDGRDPETGLPCDEVSYELPRLTIEKTSDTTELPEDGGVVSYTVTVVNEGPGATTEGDDAIVDDLSDVLDDGVFVEGSEDATSGTITFSESDAELSWTGALAAGESVELTYEVAYDSTLPDGDHILHNVVCLPENIALDPDALCDEVVVPAAALQMWKDSDPDSDTSVTAGDIVTYTLSFDSVGEVAATVDNVDDLSNVFDDADFVEGSLEFDDGLLAELDGDQLLVTGSVPAGELATVTYQVQVREYDEQGDHILENVLDCPGGDAACSTRHPIRELDLVKDATPNEGVNVGDEVTYTITVTNIGEGDYTDETPASITDDLSGVFDDAEYNGDVTIELASGASVEAPVVEGEELTWSGPVVAGDVATITYSVTIMTDTADGDHSLVNVVCETGTDKCDDVEILVPNIVFDKVSDPETEVFVEAGEVVTYTLLYTNTGQAPGPVDSTDDLSGVLDDADVTSDPSSSDDAVTATLFEDSIRVVGDIAPGETVTVIYEITIRPDGERGDNIVINTLTPDTPVEPPPPVVHRIPELEVWKDVDPASGTTVQAGEELTYTLSFRNLGEAPVEVDQDDVLTRVLDDAEIISDPVASDDALSVSDLDGDRFTITGSLEAGQTETVTYTVRVLPDGERGDDRLGNFLVPSGEEPPEECVPDSVLCTVHDVTAPGDELPGTGVSASLGAIAALLTLGLGGLLVGVRRRLGAVTVA